MKITIKLIDVCAVADMFSEFTELNVRILYAVMTIIVDYHHA